MAYFFSKYNNIIKVIDNTVTLVPMQEGHPEYELYVEFLQSEIEVTQSELYAEEEIITLKKASVPETVSRRQLRLALVLSSFDLSIIDGVINQLPEPNRSFALIAWNDAIVFERKDALLNQLAGRLGLSEDNLDDLFINASKL